MQTTKPYTVHSNFIERGMCNYLINFFENNETHSWIGEVLVCRLYEFAWRHDSIKKLIHKMNMFGAKNFGEGYYLQNIEVAKRTDLGMRMHKDYGYHDHAMICFLNDDYDGGQAIVEDNHIDPEIGKAIVLEGNKVEHGVSLTDGDRYVLLCWWSRI